MKSVAKILLFYDETPEAHAALLRCAQLANAPSVAVHVVVVVDHQEANAKCAGMLSGLAFGRTEAVAHSTLFDAIEQLRRLGVTSDGVVEFGVSADAISKNAIALISVISRPSTAHRLTGVPPPNCRVLVE